MSVYDSIVQALEACFDEDRRSMFPWVGPFVPPPRRSCRICDVMAERTANSSPADDDLCRCNSAADEVSEDNRSASSSNGSGDDCELGRSESENENDFFEKTSLAVGNSLLSPILEVSIGTPSSSSFSLPLAEARDTPVQPDVKSSCESTVMRADQLQEQMYLIQTALGTLMEMKQGLDDANRMYEYDEAPRVDTEDVLIKPNSKNDARKPDGSIAHNTQPSIEVHGHYDEYFIRGGEARKKGNEERSHAVVRVKCRPHQAKAAAGSRSSQRSPEPPRSRSGNRRSEPPQAAGERVSEKLTSGRSGGSSAGCTVPPPSSSSSSSSGWKGAKGGRTKKTSDDGKDSTTSQEAHDLADGRRLSGNCIGRKKGRRRSGKTRVSSLVYERRHRDRSATSSKSDVEMDSVEAVKGETKSSVTSDGSTASHRSDGETVHQMQMFGNRLRNNPEPCVPSRSRADAAEASTVSSSSQLTGDSDNDACHFTDTADHRRRSVERIAAKKPSK